MEEWEGAGVGAAYKCISVKGWPNNALVQCALDMITGNHPIITFCTSKTYRAPSFRFFAPFPFAPASLHR